ncbi:MAG: (E)-4-hydroxy-3-methylbut-2-enyl-diphosphate synthase [Treponema sp.]|nr:(E)-4-hydroxy-3-methylbut-2-enyl-diphosphate synthase [Treponema sp.]
MFPASRIIKIGGFDHVRAVIIGGDLPVVVQTMWKDRLFLSDSTVERIESLGRMGCGLVRFAVPDIAAAETLGRLAALVSMPLVADIHFDYKIALRCLDFPIAKIRINPGNIGDREKVRRVLEKAGEKGIPIRIGVNAGSLPQDLREKYLTQRHKVTEKYESLPSVPPCLRVIEQGIKSEALVLANALVEAAERELALCSEFGFTNVLVSMKASGIADTINANRILRKRSDVAQHIGVTEAGPLAAGIARSSAALSLLLAEGIGDTLRVSLSDTMENEVIAAREICGAAAEIAGALRGDPVTAGRLRRGGVRIISCPRCGRHGFDTHGFCERWLARLYGLEKDIAIAVMGCEVNGPQEAKHADLGITGAGNRVLIFRYGKIVRTVSAADADAAFAEELALF